MANKSSVVPAFVAGPIVTGSAYGINSLLTAGETASTELSLDYGLPLLVGTSITFVAFVPLLGCLLKGLRRLYASALHNC